MSLFAVMLMKKNIGIRVNNCEPPLEQDTALIFADGMIGAIPVFNSREDAEKYADGANIIEIEEA